MTPKYMSRGMEIVGVFKMVHSCEANLTIGEMHGGLWQLICQHMSTL